MKRNLWCIVDRWSNQLMWEENFSQTTCWQDDKKQYTLQHLKLNPPLIFRTRKEAREFLNIWCEPISEKLGRAFKVIKFNTFDLLGDNTVFVDES